MFYKPKPATHIDCSEEFQKRRRRTWRKARVPLAILALSAILTFFFVPEGPEAGLLGLGAVIALAVPIVWLVIITRLNYKCPSCNETPMTPGGSSVALDPETCNSCGAHLKPGLSPRSP